MTPTVPINLDQVFLPYFNLVTQQSGWQFGLPVRRNQRGMAARLAKRADVSIVIVLEDGTIKDEPHPILVGANPFSRDTRPPHPQWAWVPFNVDGEIDYARVVSPTMEQGSVPLQTVAARTLPNRASARALLTPNGRMQYGMPKTSADSMVDITLKSDLVTHDGDESEIKLGEHSILRFEQHSGRITVIFPSEWSLKHQLWSSHLYRVAHVLCAP